MERLNYLVIELENIHFLNENVLMFRSVIASFSIERDAIDYCSVLNERGLICKVFNVKCSTHE